MNLRNILTDCTAVIVLCWHWFLGNCPTFIMLGTFVLICVQLRYWWVKTFSKKCNRRETDRDTDVQGL